MDFMRRRFRAEGGPEEMLGILIGVMMLSAIVYFGDRMIQAQKLNHAANTNVMTLDDVRDRIDASAYEAQAIFIPATDVNNQSNADGHELDILGHDVNHNGHFVAYCFKSSAAGTATCNSTQTAGTLGLYRYTWAQLPANGGTGVAESTMVAALTTVKFVTATTPAQFASNSYDPVASGAFASFASVNSWPVSQTYHWGYPNVTSSTGQIFAVSLSAGTNTLVANVDAEHIPFASSGPIGTQTPTPNPLETDSPPLAFRAPIAQSQAARVSESNYGNRSTTPPQVYYLGTGCNSYASISPGSPVAPSSNGSGDATLTVLPSIPSAPNGVASQSCNITVTDNTPQTQIVGVTIGPTYTPTASGTSVEFTAGATAPVALAEQNYDVPAPSGRGGFTLYGYLSNGAEALSSADRSGDPNGVCSTAVGTSGRASSSLGAAPSYIESESWNIGFSKAGVCYPVFSDVYGQLVTPGGGLTATGPLTTLGQVEFAGSTVAMVTPEERLAKVLNLFLGGDTAAAGTTSCSYAQLWLQGGALDTNSEDGFNSTDGNGCVTNSQVRLWATESGYSGLFDVPSFGCGSYAQISQYNWGTGSYSVITPIASTNGCTFPVASTDHTVANGGSESVDVIVDPAGCPSGEICVYLDISAGTSPTTHCDPLTGVCTTNPGSPAVAAYFWSNDGGSSWTEYESNDNYDCAVGPPGTPVSSFFPCTATQTAPKWTANQATYSGGFAFGGDGAGTLWGGTPPPSNIEDEFDAVMCQWYRNTWAAEPPGGYPGCS